MDPNHPQEHVPKAVPVPVAVPKAVAVAVAVVVAEAPLQTLAHVDDYLKKGQESDASDIHLPMNCQPTWRRYGNLEPIWLKAPMLTAADTERLALGFLDEAQQKILHERGDVDFAYATNFGRLERIRHWQISMAMAR